MSVFFKPAPTRTPIRLSEGSIVDVAAGQIDSDDSLYRRLGAMPRDLLGTTLRRAQDLSVALYRGNPLANRIISIYRSFLAGEGSDVGAENPEVAAVIDDFWTSPRNNLEKHHRDYARDWLLAGEGFHPFATDEMGNTTVGYIDPTSVTRIRRDPGNNMVLTTVHVTRGAEDIPLEIIRRQTDPTEPDAGLYVGETTAWLYDRIMASTRGTPFLLPSLDWLDAYDQVLWEMLERQKALRAHFWKVTVDGGQDEIDLAEKLFGTTAPRSGSVRFVTNAMEVTAESPQLGAYEDAAAARYQHQHIAVGAGLAPHWLGSYEDANRSTAEQMDIPVMRSLTDTQAEWRGNMLQMLHYAVDRKVAAGQLPAVLPRYQNGVATGDMLPAHELVTITLPAVSEAKVESAATTLAQVAAAFVQLDMLGVIGEDTMRMVVRQVLPALGVPASELPEPEDDPAGERSAVAETIRRYGRL